MARFKNFVPHGVIPACLLPFRDDFSIDEPGFRKHLTDVAAVDAAYDLPPEMARELRELGLL